MSDDRFTPFPLTQAQRAYFIGRYRAFTFGGIACRAFVELVLPQAVPIEILNQALRTLIERHDMLRLVIENEGYQRVVQDVAPFSLSFEAAHDLQASALEQRIHELCEQMMSASVDYQTWPLFQTHVFQPHTTTHFLIKLLSP